MKHSNKKTNKLTLTLIIIAAVLVLVLAGLLIFLATRQETLVETVPPTIAQIVTDAPTEEPTEAPTETIPAETKAVMLDYMAELYNKNQDVAGYVKIAGTKIDYPVVFTPDDSDKYLYTNLDGVYSYAGEINMDIRCSIDPESTNIILNGHNMNDGSMFNSILKYEQKEYWEEHPIINYSTLYEEREYMVIAAYRDQIYSASKDVFRFYQFTDPQTEEEFNEGMEYMMSRAAYDTGLTAEFGDRLLLLVTCAYHTENGRFVVIAKEVTTGPEETAPAATNP